MGKEVIVSREGNIGRVTVNRPEQLNAMNAAARSAIAAAFEQFGEFGFPARQLDCLGLFLRLDGRGQQSECGGG